MLDATHGSKRRGLAERFDAALPFALTAVGLLHPESPLIWFASLAIAFVAIAGTLLIGAGLSAYASLFYGARIQGVRRRPPPILSEAGVTAQAAWVAASFAAWPIAQSWLGHPIGLVWSLEAAGLSLWGVLVQTFFGVLAIDLWLYVKHRLLHTRALFVFHKAHHAYRDPTPFAGFAVGPVESLMTFWPILLLCIPEATHWGPAYFGLVLGFIVLNFYLHCGVTLPLIERTLPRLWLNTSAFHNIHHSHVRANFGEPLTLWDHVCKTRLEDLERGAR
ncbi:MAG: sterol desaturase family protein [Myxococcales bacterium]|nr:sterol desaturase family protein [Myxococcales bacterium]MCB9752645.1 sterol desaturase family protein [Myxococcales bacterium]